MSQFPLNIVWPKVDTPERLQALAEVPEDHKILAEDYNVIIRALNELNLRVPFIKTGKVLYLQNPLNAAESDPTIGDWAIRVTDDGDFEIAQYNGDDGNGAPTFVNERTYKKQ